MAPGLFACEAVYYGRRLVQGSQSSATLTALVDHLVQTRPSNSTHDSQTYAKLRHERCQLQCDEERLRVTPVRKDEGFESDSESSGSACDESFCGTQDIKVINDHVLRLEQLIHEDGGSASLGSASDDISSSATSSGAESEDDTPRPEAPAGLSHTPATNAPHNHVDAGGGTGGGGGGGGGGVGGGGGGGGGSGDMFLMSDILYCHVATSTPRVVVVVVKDAEDSQVHAHVFQCFTEEAARALYAHYKEASSKYKLNRYRNSKRKTDVIKGDIPSNINSSSASNRIVTNASSGNGKPPSGSSSNSSSSSNGKSKAAHLNRMGDGGGGRGSVRSVEARVLPQEKKSDTGLNVNVIEIREAQQDPKEASTSPWNLVQHTDSNGVTHIEIESGPCSLVSSSSELSADFGSIVSLSGGGGGGVHHSQLMSHTGSLSARPSSRTENFIGGSVRGTSSCPNSLVSMGREVLVAGEIDKKFRQRQPAMLLPRDELNRQERIWKAEERQNEDIFKRNENRKETSRREEKKKEETYRDDRSRRGRHEGERSALREVTRAPVEAIIPRLTPERHHRSRDQSRGRVRHSHNKGPAPPPPPRRHPDNPSLLLVPTKSGSENARSFYPKESHIVRGNKIVRSDFPAYMNGWMAHDMNNNPHHYNYYNHGGAWVGPHEYHALRPRESTITPEMRRRSRSKSPARRPMAHRYIDAVSTFSLSQKLKDFSDAVFTNKRNANTASYALGNSLSVNQLAGVGSSGGEIKGHQRSMSTVSAPPGDCDGTLRPVIKKGRKQEGSPQTRRVTFSAYATVQVMDA